MKRAAVIGSGVAGLATAIRLALKGLEVDVFEANVFAGGKLAEQKLGDFRFDMGPSLFTLPGLVDELYEEAGLDPKEHFQYDQLDVITKYFWEDGTTVNAFADPNDFAQELADKLNEPEQNVLRFLDNSKELYDLTSHIFLYSSLHQFSTYINKKALLTGLKFHKLDAFRSVDKANRSYFNDPRTVQLFDRYATYNGSDPYQAPATLNIIPHLEHNIGAYFPKGGMYRITEALVKLAERLGIAFHYNTPVERILHANGKAIGIQVKGEELHYDIVVTNMDMVNTYRKLLPDVKEPERLTKQPKSSSALIFYWGINKQFPQLDLHNIFFSKDYKHEFDTMFQKGDVCDDPTVYVYISSKQCKSDAPEGKENWFTMINVPNNTGQNWDEIKSKARQAIINKLSGILGEDVASLIEVEDVLDPVLIESRTSSHQGALYGNSSNNMFAAFLRHANYSSQLKDLYFCGGSVHPGGGIPLCLLSARITADLVEKKSL